MNAPTRTEERTRGSALLPVALLVTIMWVSEVLDALLPAELDEYGIVGRSLEGLRGIPLSPFLHGDFAHLGANTVPFLVLGALVGLEGRAAYWKVTGTVGGLGGLGTWLLSPPGVVVVGASGVVFGYLTYLVTRGVLSRRAGHVLVAVLVMLVYGSVLLGVLPGTPGVSWEAHLAGAIAGIVAARWLRTKRSARS